MPLLGGVAEDVGGAGLTDAGVWAVAVGAGGGGGLRLALGVVDLRAVGSGVLGDTGVSLRPSP